MIKLRTIIGTLLIQTWVYTNLLTLYIFWRMYHYQEIWLILSFFSLWFLQLNVGKSQLVVKVVQWFDIMSWFDDHQIIEDEKVQKTNSIFCYHPHGIYSYCLLFNLYRKGTLFENIICLGSRAALTAPLSGLIIRLYGIEGVHPQNFNKHLKNGQNVVFVPGGFEEATMTSQKENRLFLKQRKGFIKYALRYGATVYPLFTFGENSLFQTFDKFMNFRLWLNKIKMPGTIFWSRFLSIPEPHNSVVTVCGQGLKCPKIENPTIEDIEKYHQEYIKLVQQLYEKYSPKYAPKIALKIF
ncbi:hypothetical protein pb186bvf_000662 [Paramecium bursaria]